MSAIIRKQVTVEDVLGLIITIRFYNGNFRRRLPKVCEGFGLDPESKAVDALADEINEMLAEVVECCKGKRYEMVPEEVMNKALDIWVFLTIGTDRLLVEELEKRIHYSLICWKFMKSRPVSSVSKKLLSVEDSDFLSEIRSTVLMFADQSVLCDADYQELQSAYALLEEGSLRLAQILNGSSLPVELSRWKSAIDLTAHIFQVAIACEQLRSHAQAQHDLSVLSDAVSIERILTA